MDGSSRYNCGANVCSADAGGLPELNQRFLASRSPAHHAPVHCRPCRRLPLTIYRNTSRERALPLVSASRHRTGAAACTGVRVYGASHE
ncbi:unnamed protein product [Colias eurytheme]|nr:unnamed protein product [Colias eurytheme]